MFSRLRLLVLLNFTITASFAQTITQLQKGKPTSIRGLSVVDDSIAWISGSKGYFAITRNGGKTWDWQQVKGYEKSDFRDIEAFSDKEAIVMSSGTPALILKTVDGGATWQEKYRNIDTAYFFDAMDFANKNHGLVLGDPIYNRFVLMETLDGGETWKPYRDPPTAHPGEAAFAASGTCITMHGNFISVVTGGTYSRLLIRNDDPSNNIAGWNDYTLSIKHGKPSQGAFSISDNRTTLVVGGDYQNDHLTDSTAVYFHDGNYFGPDLRIAENPPAGFQSCVEYIIDETFLSTGTPGSNITIDRGKTWRQIDTASYNVCRKAKNGKLVLLAGNNGAIGALTL